MKIISFSTSSRTPSSSLTPTIVFNSSSVINGSDSFGSAPNNLINRDEIAVNKKTNGLNITTQNCIGFDTFSETASDFCLATVFGVISPKISTKTVITPVDIATAESLPLKSLTANDVAIEEAPMFTILLPISIAPKSLFGLSVNFSTSLAPLTPSSTIFLILILLKAINAVSDIEKKPDISNKITKIIICPV